MRSSRRVARIEVERVVRLCLEGIAARRMVDVGTGSGVFAEAFAKRGLKVTGIDINPDAMEIAEQFVPSGRFQQAPAEAVPYSDNSFDLVFLGHVLHEVDSQTRVLQEARRIATQRVAILEWPHREEEIGPPLSRRIPPDRVGELAREVGFPRTDTVFLKHMILYRLTVQ